MNELQPWEIIGRAIEEIEGWPESYARPLATWLRIAEAESSEPYYNARRPHPAVAFAREVLRDSANAAATTKRMNDARRR